MIVRMLKMIVKVIVLKIVYVNVLMRLVSITPGHVKLDWLPPPKVDRVNENNKDNDKNNNKSECDRDDKDDKDDSNDNESDKDNDKDNENENWMYWCNSEASE